MLKQIPKSDITLRPFKVYKNFEATRTFYTGSFIDGEFYTSGSTYSGSIVDNSIVISDGYAATLAYNHPGSYDTLTTEEALENGTWHQLRTMYYRDPHNLYTSYGTIKPTYSEIEKVKQRVLNDKAYVYTIPQIKFGEEIKPNSVILTSQLLNETILDDGFGNLASNYNSYIFKTIDIQNSLFIFEDPDGTELTAELVSYEEGPAIDIENAIFQIKLQDIFYLIKIDVETSFISWLGVFDTNGILKVSPVVIGNVFYSHGIITITRDTDTARLGMLDEDWQLNYQSTNTIYENEILLVVDEDEFNTSTNPTAVDFVNLQNVEYTTSFEGTKRTSKYDAARIKNDYYSEHTFPSGSYVERLGGYITESVTISGWGGFEHYEYSSSVDPIGSYLAPYVTTIGLYDENMDMVAIAKLATPIKSTPDLPVNFLVRIDT
jgi:hypothetical protein